MAPLLSTYPWEVQECDAPRSDEVYRGQIESMGKEMEVLHSDNVILRKSQEGVGQPHQVVESEQVRG